MERECIQLSVPSRLLYIGPILEFTKQLAQQLGFCPNRIKDIGLIVDEICGNAMEHGSDNSTSGIDLIFVSDASKLEITVRDKGKRNRENWLTTGRLNEVYHRMSPNNERGHGIYIAKKLSDHFEITPNSLGGTDVRVFFNRCRPKAS